jgi:1-aminocyclopropane-1-carboxylate deaminase/D-cysteine desulfhydrase-like pyridoxal-dependent ACC family enzyme
MTATAAATAAAVATLTPFQLRNGRWYKREDLHIGPGGVNGAKYRACQQLIGRAAAQGATRIISAASVLSPQSAMAAAVAAQHGLPCTVIVGGSKPATALRHAAIAAAVAAGAVVEHVPVGYNPYLQKAAAHRQAELPGSYLLRYGITCPPEATVQQLRDFHNTAGQQVANLPPEVKTLVIPFGSGNTGAGVLYGLATQGRATGLERIVLVDIGPDRRAWLTDRLRLLGVHPPAPIEHVDLYGSGYARYADRMPETADNIALHPTYEGKVARYLNEQQPPFWRRRDGTTCLWIVGGPLPRAAA